METWECVETRRQSPRTGVGIVLGFRQPKKIKSEIKLSSGSWVQIPLGVPFFNL